MKEGRHYKKHVKKKNTLKEITFYVTGVREDNSTYESEYQRIKRIRKLLKDSISIVDFTSMKDEFSFIRTMIEFVYKNKDLENALINFKNKKEDITKDVSIQDYCNIVEALENANINKKYLESNIELNNLYRVFNSIVALQKQYESIVSNVIDIFQYDANKGIEYAHGYRDTILINTDTLNKKMLFELKEIRQKDEPINLKEEKTIRINFKDPIEDYEYRDDIFIEIDFNNNYLEDIDMMKYRDLKNVLYINFRSRHIDRKKP
ncbi:TPA: hypothetical protein KQW76_002749 [Clostridioides difficile]|nr:hypothetical protein [Clostridioides difficile]EJA6689690.1 hypothetical protein [Clostridioides difficile]EQH51484.1 hypothetical protein QMG_3590 [Clostridioides difficile DA00256]MBJ9760740.1 hypothetical protein [Clostridioides difficile]MCA0587055.1 hypothetical protein [Clostridioides difficile]MDO0484835.1 hypothetical protein [Clostridioides difficile]